MSADFVPRTPGDLPAQFAIGAELPVLRRLVTQPMIDAYGHASGDLNPIHMDPDYSRTGPFGRNRSRPDDARLRGADVERVDGRALR